MSGLKTALLYPVVMSVCLSVCLSEQSRTDRNIYVEWLWENVGRLSGLKTALLSPVVMGITITTTIFITK